MSWVLLQGKEMKNTKQILIKFLEDSAAYGCFYLKIDHNNEVTMDKYAVKRFTRYLENLAASALPEDLLKPELGGGVWLNKLTIELFGSDFNLNINDYKHIFEIYKKAIDDKINHIITS